MKWGNFIENFPYMLPVKCFLIWPHCFRGEDFLEIDPPETRIAFVNRSGQNEHYL
jgi:hypothetical protein